MIDVKTLKAAMETACHACGIEDWEVVVGHATSVSASMIDDELVEFSSSIDGSIVVRVIIDGREGTASSDRVDLDDLPVLVERASQASRVKEADSGYVPEIHAPGDKYPEKTASPGPVFDAAQIRATLEKTQKALFAKDSRVSKGTGSDAASGSETTLVVNSKGLTLSDEWSSSYIASNAVVKEEGQTKEATVFREGDILSADMGEAVDKATAKFHASTTSSGKRPVIFSSECFNLFLRTFWSAFSGKTAFYGLSPYKDKLGQCIASRIVTLVDDPLYPDYPAQKCFDADCSATFTKPVIEDGVLKNLLYNRQWAQKAGAETTGNAVLTSAGSAIMPYSFHLRPGIMTLDELALEAGEGIYVTQMKGFHAGADPVSGDFSIESSGFLVQEGRIGGPLEGFTVAGNFFQLLKDVRALGDDLVFDVTLSSFRCGSPCVLVDGLSIAGQ